MTKLRKNFTQEQKEAFAAAANPHEWLLVALNLHDQAQILWKNRGQSLLILRRPGYQSITWDETDRATYLLAAFAMENMLKAFLVYEHPENVSNGYLSNIATHDLSTLASNSTLIPYRRRDGWVYEALSDGNESWARYPCGRDADDIQLQGFISEKLWYKYCKMINLYQKKMENFLVKGWIGPYGDHGKWTFEFPR